MAGENVDKLVIGGYSDGDKIIYNDDEYDIDQFLKVIVDESYEVTVEYDNGWMVTITRTDNKQMKLDPDIVDRDDYEEEEEDEDWDDEDIDLYLEY